MTNSNIAVLVERGTNPTEFNYSRLRLREAGATVTVIGLDRLEYELEDHSTGYADVMISQVAGQTFDGVVIPGGLGPEKLRQRAQVLCLVQDCYTRGKVCAAICHGQQVMISAGLMRGVHATAAWSMMDDLRAVGAIVPEGARAVRDGQIVTAIFPRDLPQFFHLVFEAFADLQGCVLPAGHGQRLRDQIWGIIVDDASDATQVDYLRLRIQEEGGHALLLGRKAGQQVRLSSSTWEWGEMGWHAMVDRALPNIGAVRSCDTEAESNSLSISFQELDGLLLPGGLATWMIRGHPGITQLVNEMNVYGKPIGAIERGPKVLLTTGMLEKRVITCAPQMRDDIIYAVADIEYLDKPVVCDGNLLTAQGTNDLPQFMRTLIRVRPSKVKLGLLITLSKCLQQLESTSIPIYAELDGCEGRYNESE
ncbi:MAG: DJ-1/PfpI family protein [Anaerolineae bacterium]|nr:DJ-1/PfpI family protein [Anaerolineae bacterium]